MANYQDSINSILSGIKSFVEEIQTANHDDGEQLRQIRARIDNRTEMMSKLSDGLHECADVMDTIVELNDETLDFDGEEDFVGYDEGYQIHIEQIEDEKYADEDEDEDEVSDTINA